MGGRQEKERDVSELMFTKGGKTDLNSSKKKRGDSLTLVVARGGKKNGEGRSRGGGAERS